MTISSVRGGDAVRWPVPDKRRWGATAGLGSIAHHHYSPVSQLLESAPRRPEEPQIYGIELQTPEARRPSCGSRHRAGRMHMCVCASPVSWVTVEAAWCRGILTIGISLATTPRRACALSVLFVMMAGDMSVDTSPSAVDGRAYRHHLG